MEGILLKRGRVSWNPRYVLIRGMDLLYFYKQGDKEEKGSLEILPETECIDYHKRPFSFQVKTNDNLITLCALNANDEMEWKKCIKETIKKVTYKNSLSKNKKDWQIVSAAGQDFEMSSQYELIKAIGHGAYGVVISAHDNVNNTKVAIKKIPDTFEDLVDAKRIVREIHLLSNFKHDNIIRVCDLFTSQSYDDFDEVYMVTDLMETDMHRVIYSKQPLTLEHIQYFLYQCICGLNYIHSAGVIHRDLKPSNILVNSNCDLKLCDFGLSRGAIDESTLGDDVEEVEELTEYVVTRWYRAPEIMLSCPSYDSKIDVWSMGCIFGEMLGRKPMFPGSDYIHQLKLIMKVIGTPPDSQLYFVTNSKARKFIKNMPKYDKIDLLTAYPKSNEIAVDLLIKMLCLDPMSRLSCNDILKHEFFDQVRNINAPCERIRQEGIIDWGEIETCELTKRNLQDLLIKDFNALEKENNEKLKMNINAAAGKKG